MSCVERAVSCEEMRDAVPMQPDLCKSSEANGVDMRLKRVPSNCIPSGCLAGTKQGASARAPDSHPCQLEFEQLAGKRQIKISGLLHPRPRSSVMLRCPKLSSWLLFEPLTPLTRCALNGCVGSDAPSKRRFTVASRADIQLEHYAPSLLLPFGRGM